MKNMGKLIVLYGLMASFMAAGCAKEQGGAPSKGEKASNEPVTIRMYHSGGNISDDEFEAYFINPVAQKYPNITLELVRNIKGQSPEELLGSNSFPDFIYTSNPNIPYFQGLDVLDDLTPFVQKYGLDLGRFQSEMTNLMKLYDSNKLLGLPITANVSALIYNKDIFDKFAVEYPKDGMNWDEAVQLGKRVARSEAGISYIGIDPWRVDAAGQQMSLPLVDPKTNKATIVSDGWKRVLGVFKDAADIPGYVFKADYDFFKDNIAMTTTWATDVATVAKSKDQSVYGQKNWDLATLPGFQGFEGKGRGVDSHLLALSRTSKHKDEAFKVMMEVVSDEVQISMAKSGRISPLKDASFKNNYLQDYPAIKNSKNLQALFQTTPAPLPPPSKYEGIARTVIRNMKKKVAVDKLDINTVLREAQEEADKAIEAELQKTK